MSVEAHPLFGEGGKPPSSVKELVLYEIGVDLAMELNEEWHSLLPETVKSNLVRNKHKAFYAMEFDGRYYATAIWTSPVAGNRLIEPCIELRRMAISEDAPRNTATRMLRLMRESLKRKFPDIKKAISYQAKKYHYGTIYKADNWTAASESQVSWTNRKRKEAQASDSTKVRWERYL